MKFDLLVFDWDGTLMDSAARIVQSFQRAIAQTGVPALSDAAISNIIGLGLHEAVATLYPELDSAQNTQLCDNYRQFFFNASEATPLFEGAADTVRQLAEEGYLLAVATGKSRRGLEKVLDESGLRAYFRVTRCADESGSKPQPFMLHEIIEELGVSAAKTLMIGDTEYDLEMARNAGTASLGVTYGVHELARLQKHQPLTCIDAISELPAYLRQLSEMS